MKKAFCLLALAGATLLAGCGGVHDGVTNSTYNNGSGNQPFKPVSHLSFRSIVTNYYVGSLDFVDALQNRVTSAQIPVGQQPTYLQASLDGTLIFINNTGAESISSFNSWDEAVKGTVSLGGWTESFVTSADNKFGFAAVYNYNNGLAPLIPGAIVRFNPVDGSLDQALPLPYVRYLAADVTTKHLLAFTDVPEVNAAVSPTAAFQAHWVDLTTTDVNGLPPISTLPLPPGTLSRPVTAFFSSDGTKAYILNCGVECGGPSTTIGNTVYSAWITVVNVQNPAAATVIARWGVPGATTGVIDRYQNKLWIAGSSKIVTDSAGNSVFDGNFTLVDLTNGPVHSVQTGNGNQRIIRSVNGNYWIGAQNCGAQSCITIVDPGATTATVLPQMNGNVTGITYNVISGDVYAIEGQGLKMYDQKGNPVTSEYGLHPRTALRCDVHQVES